jgi:hypothetical protein
MIRWKGTWLMACGLWAIACSAAVAAAPIAPRQFGDILALIKPARGEEQWTQIPWLTSLWKARRQAAALGKPILLWEMDGHPLGCT